MPCNEGDDDQKSTVIGGDDRKSTVVSDIGRPNERVGDEAIWPANVADEPVNSAPHRPRRAFSQTSSTLTSEGCWKI
jgi:hypothetical protein